ncbi:phosphotransferase, partial [Kineococcus sp. R8]|uniref:phosphotransferase n=1 Tax=Kineococcus siccus TaxID=2696567 RepID=UPI00141282F6
MEERLAGGRDHGAVRVGDTVRRHAGSRTPAVHALLRHLHDHGFTRAPEPRGLDEQGREVLTYLAGRTVGEDRPWPAWAHRDDTLVQVGTWLREFHDAVASFTPPAGAHWFGDRDDLRPGEVVGHHDAAPYNAVWRPAPTAGDPGAGELVGFVDWDLAGPAPAVRDLAFTALTWVPLTARDVAAADGFPADTDRWRRLRLLLAAYG